MNCHDLDSLVRVRHPGAPEATGHYPATPEATGHHPGATMHANHGAGIRDGNGILFISNTG